MDCSPDKFLLQIIRPAIDQTNTGKILTGEKLLAKGRWRYDRFIGIATRGQPSNIKDKIARETKEPTLEEIGNNYKPY